MKKLLFILGVSVLVLSLAGFASAQQRGYQQEQWDQQRQYGQQQQEQWGRQQDQSQQRTGRMTQRRQPMVGNFHKASDLMDKKIKSQQGQDLGEVKDLIITRNGQVAFLLVSRGGVMGMGGETIPIPFRSAGASWQQDQLILSNVDKQMLDNAPTISENDLQRLEDPQFQREVFSYYGGGQQQQYQQQQPGAFQQQQRYQQQQPGSYQQQEQQRPMQQQRSGQMGR